MEREEVPAMQDVSLSTLLSPPASEKETAKQSLSSSDPRTPDRSAAESAGRWAREANNSTLGWTRNSIAAADPAPPLFSRQSRVAVSSEAFPALSDRSGDGGWKKLKKRGDRREFNF